MMSDVELLAKITIVKNEAHALKEKYVIERDFEAAACWRDIALMLEKAVVQASSKLRLKSVEVVIAGNDGGTGSWW
jgi:hypothetical protein